jgi:hypothetical protein
LACSEHAGKKERMKVIITLLASMFLIFTTGCSVAKNSSNAIGGEVKYSGGIKYKIVEVEGRKFVATQTSYDYWTLAGPID